MRHLLYHFGYDWYVVQLLDLLTVSVAAAQFVVDGTQTPTNVFDYTRTKTQHNSPPWVTALDPNSPAIRYQTPGNSRKRFGAVALCKLLLNTDDPCVRLLHRRSIKPPQERFDLSRQIVMRCLSDGTFGTTPIEISAETYAVQPKLFHIPALEFGQGQILHVGTGPGRIPLRDFARSRLDHLLDSAAGFAVTSPLDVQHLLVPLSLERQVTTDFKKRIDGVVREFIHAPYHTELVVFDDRQAWTLKAQVDAILAVLDKMDIQHGRGILILPAQAKKDLHNYLKRRLKDRWQFQCVAAAKLRDFYCLVKRDATVEWQVRPDRERRYTSYLRYTALGLLIVNRQWGWVLADSMHYDAYIAVDVLHHTAAFCFFYEGGRRCFLVSAESKRKEKLLRQQVRELVYRNLKDHLQGRAPIRSLVLRRDGKLFAEEWAGLELAIQQLQAEGLLPEELLYGAVEVQKTSLAAVRMARHTDNGLANPRIATAYQLGDKEGLLCTTGFPFSYPGTVKPLHVCIAHGALDLWKVLEDTAGMALLAWAAPDRSMRLSIDLKLCDDFLRAVAAEADQDEAAFGEVDEAPDDPAVSAWGGATA